MPIMAHIESISPENNTITNQQNISIDFYLSMSNVNKCILYIGNRTIQKTSLNAGFNKIMITNIEQGNYDWYITCQNDTLNETTTTRKLIIDLTEPDVVINKPSGQITKLNLSFTAIDDPITNNMNYSNYNSSLNCSIFLDNQTIDSTRIISGSTYDKYYDNNFLLGNHTLKIICTDVAGNQGFASRDINIYQQDFLQLSTDKQAYSLGESVHLIINSLPDANISIDICPYQQGFVQCISPIINQGDYPQILTLPTNNKTGIYVIEAYAITPRGSFMNQTNYSIQNNIVANLLTSEKPKLNNNFKIYTNAHGGIGSLTYEWHLTNGTVLTTTNDYINMTYKSPGTYNETVIITDSVGNSITKKIPIVIKSAYSVTILVRDKISNNPISGATVMIANDNDEYFTDPDGKIKLDLEKGTTKIYSEKENYDYKYKDIYVDENNTFFNITLNPQVINFSISELNVLTNPFTINFKVLGARGALCSLLTNSSGSLSVDSSITVNDESSQSLSLQLPLGTYEYSISCTQDSFITSTPVKSLTIDFITSTNSTNTNTNTNHIETNDLEGDSDTSINNNGVILTNKYDDYKLYFEDVLNNLESLDSENQELADELGIIKQVRLAKKKAGQLGRDLFDLEKGNDENKNKKITSKIEELHELVEKTPVSINVIDSKTISKYISKKDMEELFDDTTFKNSFKNYNLKKFLSVINSAQQRYTMTTKMYHTTITYGSIKNNVITREGINKEISLVTKEFSYGTEKSIKGYDNEFLIEVLPKDLSGIILVTDGEKIGSGIYKFPSEESITYYFDKEIAFSELSDSKTLLMPDLNSVDNDAITGMSILGLGTLDTTAKKFGVSTFILLMIILALYLAYYFNLIDYIRFTLFKISNKKDLHYIRVLINDVKDNLKVGDYDKALMIYKEITLSYEKLNKPTKNELRKEIIELCAELDKYYMNSLIIKMDKALKDDQLELAIDYFSKIEGTYERLPEVEQSKVLSIVTNLATRLGLGDLQ